MENLRNKKVGSNQYAVSRTDTILPAVVWQLPT
jgi:hypothetical protein